VEWPDPILNERARYMLDARVFARNAARDLLALIAFLVLGMPLFEIALIYVLDAVVRVVETALRIRLARDRPRGAIASPVFASPARDPVDHNDPQALARAMLAFSLFAVLLCGGIMVAAVVDRYGTGDVHLIRALAFFLLYTIPFAVHEHWRWMVGKRDRAVPHILARDLSWLSLFASIMVMIFWGALPGVVAFVVLRALNDAAELVPSWSVDGVSWSTQWQGEWDALRTDGPIGRRP
jgi:hypothetical protein